MKFIVNKHKGLELILLGLIVLALIVLIGIELRYISYKKVNSEIAAIINVIKEQSNTITTKDDYDMLLKECKEFIYNNYTSSSNIDTNIIVEENLYVDSEKQETEEDKLKFNHVNTVYCKGMLLVSFLNNSGEMKSVAAVIDKQAGDIKAVDISDMSVFENFNDYGTNKEIDCIGSLIVNILKSDKSDLNSTTAYEYFTEDGYNDFISQLDNSNSIDNAEITFMKVGKSDINMEYYDRIIIQLITSDESRNIIVNTLLKVDKNGKIFDIDII